MTELIEINEGNCVLTNSPELEILKYALGKYANPYKHHTKEWCKMMTDRIFQKITKLNDMAKEKQKRE